MHQSINYYKRSHMYYLSIGNPSTLVSHTAGALGFCPVVVRKDQEGQEEKLKRQGADHAIHQQVGTN
jgi:hypothetical protein